MHRHILADLQSSNLPVILGSGSVAEKAGSWNLIDLFPIFVSPASLNFLSLAASAPQGLDKNQGASLAYS